MNSEDYAIVALFARYGFVALALYIVFRGWRASVTDNRRARLVRDASPDLGAIGELLVVADVPKGKMAGARIPLPREGILGSSRMADVRIARPGVRRRHLWLEQRVGCVAMKPIDSAPVEAGDGPPYAVRDGETFGLAGLTLMVVLFDAADGAPPAADSADAPGEDEELSWQDDNPLT